MDKGYIRTKSLSLRVLFLDSSVFFIESMFTYHVVKLGQLFCNPNTLLEGLSRRTITIFNKIMIIIERWLRRVDKHDAKHLNSTSIQSENSLMRYNIVVNLNEGNINEFHFLPVTHAITAVGF